MFEICLQLKSLNYVHNKTSITRKISKIFKKFLQKKSKLIEKRCSMDSIDGMKRVNNSTTSTVKGLNPVTETGMAYRLGEDISQNSITGFVVCDK